MNVDQKLGLTIKKIREEKNLSQSELGKISGIERTTIAKLEKGEHSPSLKTIHGLAKALEMKTYEFIKDYIENYHPLLVSKSKSPSSINNVLILSNRGNKMYNYDVSQVLKRLAKNAGIDKDISPHTIRHTLATHLLKNGMGIRYIQELLGHEDISTTQIYTQIENKDLHIVIDKYHPLSDNIAKSL